MSAVNGDIGRGLGRIQAMPYHCAFGPAFFFVAITAPLLPRLRASAIAGQTPHRGGAPYVPALLQSTLTISGPHLEMRPRPGLTSRRVCMAAGLPLVPLLAPAKTRPSDPIRFHPIAVGCSTATNLRKQLLEGGSRLSCDRCH